MLNLNIKPSHIKKKIRVLKTIIFTKNPTTQREVQSPACLPNVLVTAICPSLAKSLSQQKLALSQKEAALELEKIELQKQVARLEAAANAEAEKQATIRQGAATMFKENRLHSQRELEKQQRAAEALERGLREATQKELDVVNHERDHVTTALLVATTSQIAAASAAVEAKHVADAIGKELAQALEVTQNERLHFQKLAARLQARSEELDRMTLCASKQQERAREHLRASMEQYIKLETLSAGVQRRVVKLEGLLKAAKADRAESTRQVQTAKSQAVRVDIAARAIEHVHAFVEKEGSRMLEEKRHEANVALAEARATFEELREREKARLAASRAKLEESQAAVDDEKKKVEMEKERLRLLENETERERAASIDAKQAALGQLQQAMTIRDESVQASLVAKEEARADLRMAEMMREESKWAIVQLFAIAGNMADSTGAGGPLSTLTIEDGFESADTTRVDGDDKDGRMSRMGVYQDQLSSGTIGATKSKLEAQGIIETGVEDATLRGTTPLHGYKDSRLLSVVTGENKPTRATRSTSGSKGNENDSVSLKTRDIQFARKTKDNLHEEHENLKLARKTEKNRITLGSITNRRA